MKDYPQKYYEDPGPSGSAVDFINFCLKQLFNDRHKTSSDIVAGYCSYEELIGALLLAKEELSTIPHLYEQIAFLEAELNE